MIKDLPQILTEKNNRSLCTFVSTLGKLNHSLLLFEIILFMLLLSGCDPQKEVGVFQQISPKESGLHFNNHFNPTGAINIINYLYAYNGGGVGIGDVNNDNLPDIYLTGNQVDNKLFLNKGNLQFEDITITTGVACNNVWSTGVTMVDINGDGWLDLYVCQLGNYRSLKGTNKLFINNGKKGEELKFTEQAAAYGLDISGLSTHATFFDYDLDGDLDLYLLKHSVHEPSNYSDTTARYNTSIIGNDQLFQNKEGRFVDVSGKAGIYQSKVGYGLGVAISDLNLDGYPDIYVSNDFHENDYCYINQQNGTFKEVSYEWLTYTSKFSMGLDIADINNDGRTDIFTLDMKPWDLEVIKMSQQEDDYQVFDLKTRKFGYHKQYAQNCLHLNKSLGDGNLAFQEVARAAHLDDTDWSWSALSADFDLDGRKDVFVSNGIYGRPNDLDYLKFISNDLVQKDTPDSLLIAQMPGGQVPNILFNNKGNLQFDRIEFPNKTLSHGAAYGDLDDDGDLDLVVNNMNNDAGLFENTTSGKKNHYLKIKLTGPPKNRKAIGTKVQLFINENMQLYEVYPSRGFMSSSDTEIVFGLGMALTVDSLVCYFPNGLKQKLTNLSSDTTYSLSAKGVLYKVKASRQNTSWKNIVTNFASTKEVLKNEYNDFLTEKLLPYKLSKEGPAILKADFDMDGFEDIFIGGKRGRSAVIWLQLKNGEFEKTTQEALENDLQFEDVDAISFDFNQDGFPDIYVVSGGYDYPPRSKELADRIYLNDGKGQFTRSPWEDANPGNGACIVVLDLNHDNKKDLFVGTRAVPGAYGLIPNHKTIIQHQNGYKEEQLPFKINGTITDAVVADLDKDGDEDLFVLSHWEPLQIYWNEGNQFSKTSIPHSSGWWNVAEVKDVDQDGKLDIICGNIGRNHNFDTYENDMLQLHTNDFDQDGKTESLIVYEHNGKAHSLFGRDELANQMVVIKKQFTDYKSFANTPFSQLFPSAVSKKSLVKKVEKFDHIILFNEGNQMFRMESLPMEAQLNSVRSITFTDVDADGTEDMILTGGEMHMAPILAMIVNPCATVISPIDQQVKIIPCEQHGLQLNTQINKVLAIPNNKQTNQLLFLNHDEIKTFIRQN